ncbi:hypothetical protein GALMADRAFT_215023 [Galerina marginata CBS 339.88]|uniref:Uncharacterized protein n=1 Tax=Galerina marginata (strain CBS 339.88) TaxID=685588 RepID=A0A067SFC5_GALM3|nr:hypothetical protein GALMADRAFT_215023 [Galerina marginata CBS 339.88]
MAEGTESRTASAKNTSNAVIGGRANECNAVFMDETLLYRLVLTVNSLKSRPRAKPHKPEDAEIFSGSVENRPSQEFSIVIEAHQQEDTTTGGSKYRQFDFKATHTIAASSNSWLRHEEIGRINRHEASSLYFYTSSGGLQDRLATWSSAAGIRDSTTEHEMCAPAATGMGIPKLEYRLKDEVSR